MYMGLDKESYGDTKNPELRHVVWWKLFVSNFTDLNQMRATKPHDAWPAIGMRDMGMDNVANVVNIICVIKRKDELDKSK